MEKIRLCLLKDSRITETTQALKDSGTVILLPQGDLIGSWKVVSTRLKVSLEGMAWVSFRNVLSHTCLALPKASMSWMVSPPQSRVQIPITKTSIKA